MSSAFSALPFVLLLACTPEPPRPQPASVPTVHMVLLRVERHRYPRTLYASGVMQTKKRALFQVYGTDAEHLLPGAEVEVRLGEDPYPATIVARKNDDALAELRTTTLERGARVTLLSIFTPDQLEIRIPSPSIVHTHSGDVVFVAENGVLYARSVFLGASNALISGVSAGDFIAADASTAIDGALLAPP